MTEGAATPQTSRAILDAWAARGADRVDPLRFRFIDAFERRVAAHSGEARRVLDAKLAALLEAYARDIERGDAGDESGQREQGDERNQGDQADQRPQRDERDHRDHRDHRDQDDEDARPTHANVENTNSSDANTATAPTVPASRNQPTPSALAGLVAELHGAARRHRRVDAAAYPELPELDYFRQTWARVRAEGQVRQSLQPAPGNAGPLNSSSLVHRSLSLMRELSPGYLKQFLSYVDALSWMEQLSGGAPASKDAPRAATGGKGGRGKTR